MNFHLKSGLWRPRSRHHRGRMRAEPARRRALRAPRPRPRRRDLAPSLLDAPAASRARARRRPRPARDPEAPPQSPRSRGHCGGGEARPARAGAGRRPRGLAAGGRLSSLWKPKPRFRGNPAPCDAGEPRAPGLPAGRIRRPPRHADGPARARAGPSRPGGRRIRPPGSVCRAARLRTGSRRRRACAPRRRARTRPRRT